MSAQPTLALIGRPNVGKSTLFNRLTGKRDALVADVPGLTRDRRYGQARLHGRTVRLVDTGGLEGEPGALTEALTAQTQAALAEADAILLMMDAREGLTTRDAEIARRVRRLGKPFLLVVNKIDGASTDQALAEFAPLGAPATVFVSAAHGRGMNDLRRWIETTFPTPSGESGHQDTTESGDEVQYRSSDEEERIRVAVVGRPNVGKSTLVNRLLGEERQVVVDAPGTTRDAIAIPFERDDGRYLLIDTAGVRRKGRVDDVAEKFSIVKSLEAMKLAHVAILVMDAREGVVDQDLQLLRQAAESGTGVLVALNKWDGLDRDQKDGVRRDVSRKLDFAPWIPVVQISALHGSGVGHLLDDVRHIYEAGRLEVSTAHLCRLLEELVAAHPPPAVRGRPIKLRFAHKAGAHPPRITIHGNQTQALPASYVRYLENGFRAALELVGNPIRLEFRTSENPYAGRRNELSRRQQKRRARVIRHRRR